MNLKKHRTILQYFNCQDHGETHAYCGHFGTLRPSSNYPKSYSLLAKCALCSGDHVTSYKRVPSMRNYNVEKNPAQKVISYMAMSWHVNKNLINKMNVRIFQPLPLISSNKDDSIPQYHKHKPPLTNVTTTMHHPLQV